jgi:hypothetical protein
MKKQTAVKWLENQLKERYSFMNSEPLFEQAKSMEKEQIENAFYDGCFDQNSWRAEHYYNETFSK